jgi:hypothetical protein
VSRRTTVLTLLSRFQRTVTLSPGVPREVDLPIDHARDWCVVVKNTGTNAVTAVTLSRSPLGELFGPETAVPTGVPLAAGEALDLVGLHEPLRTLRVRLRVPSSNS